LLRGVELLTGFALFSQGDSEDYSLIYKKKVRQWSFYSCV